MVSSLEEIKAEVLFCFETHCPEMLTTSARHMDGGVNAKAVPSHSPSSGTSRPRLSDVTLGARHRVSPSRTGTQVTT